MIKKIKQKIYFLLRKSEKYTKTDMIYLARGGFWLNFGSAFSSLASFIMAIAFANLISPETYGTFKFITSFLVLLSIPTLTGMGPALVMAIAQGNEGTLYLALKTKIKWGFLGTAGALVISGYYLWQGNHTLSFCFLIIAGFIPFFSSFALWTNYLNGKKEFKDNGKYFSIMRILIVLCIIIPLFFTKNILIIIFFYLASNALLKLLFFFIIVKKYPPNLKNDPATIKFGKHLSAMNILEILATNADKILLFHFLGPAQLAIYTLSLRPIREINNFLSSLSKLSLPKLSQRSLSELKISLPEKMFKLFIILIPITAIYILLAPLFYKIVLPQYTDSIIYSQVFALTLLLYPKMLIDQTMISHTRKKELYILKTAVPTFKIILLIIFLWLWGIWGAITALTISEVFRFVLLKIFFKKITSQN